LAQQPIAPEAPPRQSDGSQGGRDSRDESGSRDDSDQEYRDQSDQEDRDQSDREDRSQRDRDRSQRDRDRSHCGQSGPEGRNQGHHGLRDRRNQTDRTDRDQRARTGRDQSAQTDRTDRTDRDQSAQTDRNRHDQTDRTDRDQSARTSRDQNARTDHDRAARTDRNRRDQSARTDRDRHDQTDRTDRDQSTRTDRDQSARTDRDRAARTDRDQSARTDRDRSHRGQNGPEGRNQSHRGHRDQTDRTNRDRRNQTDREHHDRTDDGRRDQGDRQKAPLWVLQTYAHVQVPEKRLHGRQALQFADAAERCAKAYLARPDEQRLLDFLLLPKAGLALGSQQSQGLNATLQAYPEARIPPPPVQGPLEHREQDRVQRASRLLQKGWISKAANALLNPAKVADTTRPEVLQALKDKHPQGPPTPFAIPANPPKVGQVAKDHVEQALKSFSKETSPGLSGWSVPLLREAARRGPVLAFLTHLANQVRTGTAPGHSLLCASRLIALEKDNSQVRPIAVGEMVYRLVGKALLAALYKQDLLLPNQLGVKSPGGVEPALALLQRCTFGDLSQRFRWVTSLDFSNAFNSISRRTVATALVAHAPAFFHAAKWMYGAPAPLVLPSGEVIQSEEGVRQGDPLGPLLFSLGIKDTLRDLQAHLGPDCLIVSYLDDIYVLSQEDPLDRVKEHLQGSPLQLNPTKSFSRTLESIRTGTGLRALGSCIGTRAERRAFLQAQVEDFERAVALLGELPKQQALALLRASTQLLLRHLQRSLDPEGLEDLWERADKCVLKAVQEIRGALVESPFDRDTMALPIRDGGLGIPLHREIVAIAYPAAQEEARRLVHQILGTQSRDRDRNQDRDRDQDRDAAEETPERRTKLQAERTAQLMATKREHLVQALDPHRRNALTENASFLGARWLRILPTQKPLVLADSEVMAALSQRMLLPTVEEAQPCAFCALPGHFGHQEVCWKRPRTTIVRHDRIRDLLAQGLRASRPLSVQTEVALQGEQRADIVVQRTNRTVYYDVTVRSVVGVEARDPYATLETLYRAKKAKYRYLGESLQPFVVSQGGLLSKLSSQAYKEIQKDAGPSTASWMDQNISIALVRSRALAWNARAG
jgi:hypothetical protein